MAMFHDHDESKAASSMRKNLKFCGELRLRLIARCGMYALMVRCRIHVLNRRLGNASTKHYDIF